MGIKHLTYYLWPDFYGVEYRLSTTPIQNCKHTMPKQAKAVARPWVPKPNHSQQGRVDGNPFDYNGKRWRSNRRAHLVEYPLCAECKRNDVLTDSTVSDHIIPIRQGGDPWSWDNRQALCITHHAQKSAKERHHPKGRGGVNS